MEAYAIKLTTILIIVIYIGIHNILECHYRRNYHYMRMKALLYHNQIATQNGKAFFQFVKYCKRLKVRKSALLEVNLKTQEENVGS